MAHQPTPILIVSSSWNRGELLHTYDALAAGAVDVLEKPRADEPEDVWGPRLCAALKLVSRIKVISHPRGRLGLFGQPGAAVRAPQSEPPKRRVRIVALGASTGGPGALVDILRAFPSRFSIPVVVALHIDEPFGRALAEWFENQTQRSVACPEDGDPVDSFAGRVAMAPPGRHLTVSGRRFVLTAGAPVHSCRPSIDVLFRSLAGEYRDAIAACLLTGMGCDGAAGLLDIRRAGGITVAQDEETSVVYGMPREAALLGAADKILPLPAIGDYVGRLLATGGG
jgi:two-component system chemotaxis response regulator CheB